jgi:hypothetical protein
MRDANGAKAGERIGRKIIEGLTEFADALARVIGSRSSPGPACSESHLRPHAAADHAGKRRLAAKPGRRQQGGDRYSPECVIPQSPDRVPGTLGRFVHLAASASLARHSSAFSAWPVAA